MFDSLFQILFKYRPVVFQQGDFTLSVSRPMLVAILVACAAASYAIFTYFSVPKARGRDRAALAALRIAIVALIVFCLFRPTLILKAAVPQQNFLAVVIDDSRSMQIADRQNEPRSEFVHRSLGPDGALLRALSQRFVLREFRFSSSTDRVQSADELKYGGSATRIGQALARARDDLSGLPLAGVVLVSDGADTSDASLDESLASMKARSIPVFTVGVGAERFGHDIQVTRVETPRSVLKGTSLVVNVVVTQTGYAGETVPLEIEDNGHIVSTQEITLPSDGESATVRARFTTTDAGPRVFRFRVPPQAGEQVTQNNARDALIEVSDRREKILYFEGHPWYEATFVSRATLDDKNLQIVLLRRTADNKYLRQTVSSPNELIDGFPKTREELFAYRGVILDGAEADSFSPDQLRMLADFVSKRGGGLMMLGGRHSFAEGGWAGTPLAEVLPVVVEAGSSKKDRAEYFSEIAVRPTREGATYPVTQLADDEYASRKKWNGLPPLTAVNAIGTIKPGATVLLDGLDNRKDVQTVLAYQRYGRGTALAFTIQDSWLWQMNPKTSVKDTTFQTFWRRLARWLVESVPERVTTTLTQDRVDPGERIPLAAQVVDATYTDVNNARVVARVTAPSGKTADVPMDWTVSRDGEYHGSFVPDEDGLYSVKVSAAKDQKDLGSNLVHVRAAPGDAEYFDATMRAPLMKRIAEETGGRFFTPDSVAALPEAISFSGRGVTVVEERDLWDMPAVLLLLIALTGTEWAYRRARGLA
jgi:uncharacterized membrane protein